MLWSDTHYIPCHFRVGLRKYFSDGKQGKKSIDCR